MKKPTAIDLFSGCGGLSQGLKDAGFKVLCGCEIRPEARDAYSLNHSEALLFPDIRVIDEKQLLSDLALKKGQLDLLAACPPCQGFSSIRTKNKSISPDPRNELIFEVVRLVKALQPKTILIENVPRLLQDQRIEDFKAQLVNYEFTPGVLNAENFDVPQRRKRMILIGSRVGKIDLPLHSDSRLNIKDVIAGLPKPESNHTTPLHRIRQKFTPIVQKRIEAVKKNRSELPVELQLDCHKRYNSGFRDVYGRMSWDDVAPTITRSSHNPSKGRFIHPSENRGLTIYEIMLLQGFPNHYKLPKGLGIGKLSSLLGEAFPPPMAKAQAAQIYNHLKKLETAKARKPNAGLADKSLHGSDSFKR